MKTKICATAVIMLFAAGCATTTAARRQFEDITLPAGMAYQPQNSIVIESPTVKAAQLVYRGRLEPVTLGDAMRTRALTRRAGAEVWGSWIPRARPVQPSSPRP